MLNGGRTRPPSGKGWSNLGSNLLAILFSTVLLSATVSAVTILLCRRRAWELQPRADRWHRRPVAHFGGIAIVTAFVVGALIAGARGRFLTLVAMTLAIAVIGFCDDLRPWKPVSKLLCEFLIAAVTVYFGVIYPMPGPHWIAVGLT